MRLRSLTHELRPQTAVGWRSRLGARSYGHGALRISLAFFLVALVAGSATSVRAQATGAARVQIPNAPSCSGCRIRLQRIATLGHIDDPVLLTRASRVYRNRRGEYYVAPTAERGVIAAFDARGNQRASFGRTGAGPGEMRTISRLAIGPGDSILVFDTMNGRISLFSPERRFVRHVPLRGGSFGAAFVGQDLLVLGSARTPEAFGLPLHLIDVGSGDVRHSFGESGPPPVQLPPLHALRPFAVHTNDAVWIGRRERYEIERWSVRSPAVQLTIQRQPEWFVWESRNEHKLPWEVRPNSVLTELERDEAGNLWTLLATADREWAPRRTSGSRSGSDGQLRLPPIADVDRYLDRVIEVLDVSAGRLLAAQRVPGNIIGFVGPRLLYSQREDAQGVVLIDVWQANVVRP